MKRICLILTLLLLTGCVAPSPKFKLTMIYPDGTTKTFEGTSVSRDNATGEWSFWLPGEADCRRFKGKVICEPILDLSQPEVVSAEAEDLTATQAINIK